ncbi:helix-turn-helix transcriptional regulator [Corallococcus llansteffanensis]|uniref:WYL domain-containing protein n=1 Tax=Corallococcus llansteffanensis TaxID=2316731 RepID=A0A3A8Q595_9BACT|nr:WYL domain-containing protein [Corallococcus llansteffanensis]RKH61285.1 WYL domain-containing protein [Corallococcus llansteffanensis]
MTHESVSERLDRLLGLLASHRSWNGPALARELGVSLRTLRRDMARLAARGVPIEAERGRGGGVRVPVRMGLGRLQLNHREALDLLLALAIGERIRSPLLLSSLKGLRQKIGMAFPPEERTRLSRLRRRILHGPLASHRISESWGSPRPAVLGLVQDGFFEQRAIEVVYRTARERTTRVVEPHYLMLAWPVWYLLVWDHLRDAVRFLRLDRIESARLTDKTFQLREADAMLLVARDLFTSL